MIAVRTICLHRELSARGCQLPTVTCMIHKTEAMMDSGDWPLRQLVLTVGTVVSHWLVNELCESMIK